MIEERAETGSEVLSIHLARERASRLQREMGAFIATVRSVSPCLRVMPCLCPPRVSRPSLAWAAGYTGGNTMRRLKHCLQSLAAIAAIAVVLGTHPDAAQGPALRRLNGVEELKSWFNAGVGHPRLILLLSPT